MRRLFAAAMLMAAGVSYADSPALYDCVYLYRQTGKAGDKDIDEKYNCILRIGENDSRFYDYSSFRLDSVSAVEGVSEDVVDEYRKKEIMAENYFDQTVVQSLAEGKLRVYCDMAPDHYRYEEKNPVMEWTPVEGSDTVCGYVCHKAVAQYGGRVWTAWYSEEIPVPFGPWKVTGLPGLVLKAVDSEGNHCFEAVSFRKACGEFSTKPVPNSISISRDKFVERKNRYDKDPFSAINVESISEISVSHNKNVFVNGVKVNQHKMGCIPLEYSEEELKNIRMGKEPASGKESGNVPVKVSGYGVSVK